MNTKYSIALAFERAHPRKEVLVVRRPPDDEDLPEVWGLPAGSLREGETYREAAVRTGREKLGVEIQMGPLLNEGRTERKAYELHMRVYRAEIRDGVPSVPQSLSGVTQYTDCRWADADRLLPAAEEGSLCSQLYLEFVGSGR